MRRCYWWTIKEQVPAYRRKRTSESFPYDVSAIKKTIRVTVISRYFKIKTVAKVIVCLSSRGWCTLEQSPLKWLHIFTDKKEKWLKSRYLCRTDNVTDILDFVQIIEIAGTQWRKSTYRICLLPDTEYKTNMERYCVNYLMSLCKYIEVQKKRKIVRR